MVRVLVVEDEANIRDMIALNLRHAGMEVVEAESAEAARFEPERIFKEQFRLEKIGDRRILLRLQTVSVLIRMRSVKVVKASVNTVVQLLHGGIDFIFVIVAQSASKRFKAHGKELLFLFSYFVL